MAVHMVLGELGIEPPLAGGAVHLVLAETEGASGVLTDASMAVTLRVVAAMSLTPAVRGGSTRHVAGWGAAGRAPGHRNSLAWTAFDGTVPRRVARLPWSPFDGTTPLCADRLVWGAADVVAPQRVALPWVRSDTRPQRAALPWGAATGWDRARTAPWDRAGARPRAGRAPWGLATHRHRPLIAPWGLAALLPGVNRPLPEAPGQYGFTLPATGPVHLEFCTPSEYDSTDLVLGDHVCITQPRIPDGTSIAARRTYMQTHSLAAYRLPDMTPVPLTGFDLAADEGSFGWTLNAAGPDDILALLAPAAGLPAQLRVVLDGLTWDFVVEGLRRTRAFNRTGASITARSLASLLGDPYMPERAFLNGVPATGAQLVEDALQFTGVTLDWQVTDWLVPAGAWSFTGTPLAAVRRVADAIGALVQCPRTGSVISIRPRYSVLPWQWASATPDITLALDPLTSEGYERADKPAYEGVYVSGQAQGVLALVKRTGTAPDLLMASVTDALITHLDAARQRGESMLGGAGPQAVMSLTLPVLTGSGEPGVLDVGKLVLVNDPAGAWKGRVRSVAVRADGTTVRQSLTLERHL